MIFEHINKTQERSLLVTINTIDDVWKKIPNGVLDVFDHRLIDEEYDESEIGDFIQHNLKHEPKFEKFIEQAHKLNDHQGVIIECDFSELESMEILGILNRLDFGDKLLWIEIIKNISQLKSSFIKTDDINIIKMFLRCSTRELLHPFFHFKKHSASLVGNFDLSFPMYFETEDVKNIYSDLARNAGLYIR
jgi:hypothetical protein